jgi:hypothetical protein
MQKKWLPAVVAVIVVAVVVLIINIARSSRRTPSGETAPVKPRMQDEAMRRLRMGAGRPGGMRP